MTVAQIILSFFFFNSTGLVTLQVVGGILWALSIVFGCLPIYFLQKEGGIPEGKSHINTTKLVDSGLYGIVRHPQYLAGIFFNLALIFIAQNWIIVIIGIISAILFYIDTHNADKDCIEKFGDDYECYMESVPRINLLMGIIRLQRRRKKEKHLTEDLKTNSRTQIR